MSAKRKPVTIQRAKATAERRGGMCLSDEVTTNKDILEWECVHGVRFTASYNKVINVPYQWCPCETTSRGERICIAAFEQLFDCSFPKARPDWMPSPDSNLPLELDGYSEEISLAVEHQGSQHYAPISRWGGEKAHQKIKYRDQLKREACRAQGVTLIEIPEIGNRTKVQDLKKVIAEELDKAGRVLPENFNAIELDLNKAIGGKRPDIEIVVDMYNDGIPVSQIAEYFCLSARPIKSILVDLGVHIRGPIESKGGIVDEERLAQIRQSYESGNSIDTVSKNTGIGRKAVMGAIDRAGGTLRSHGESQSNRFGSKPLSQIDKNQICEEYKNTPSIPKLGEKWGVSIDTIWRVLNEGGAEIERSGRKTSIRLTSEEEAEIIKRYYERNETQKSIRDSYPGLGYEHFNKIIRKSGETTRRQNKKYVSPSDEIEICRLYEKEKLSKAKIMRETGIGCVHLNRILEKHNIPPNPKTKTVLTYEQEGEVRRLHSSGEMTDGRIQKEFGIGYDHFKNIINTEMQVSY